MAPKDSNSTTTNNIKVPDAQFHEQSLFTDASDSFDPHHSTKLNSARVRNVLNDDLHGNSTITTVDEDDRISATNSSISGSNFIFLLAGLVIKTLAFQFNLLFSSITLPMCLLYHSYMLMIDPFKSMNLAKCYMMRKISTALNLCSSPVKWAMHIGVRQHEYSWKLCVRLGWGLLWAVYVGFVLSSLLVFAFIVSGIVLKCMIEEPVQMTRRLSFDYTKDSPVAFVPLMSCDELFLELSEPVWYGCGVGSRVIPLDHEVYGMVSLTLPESYYNRNLGIFQVRVDFLSGDGKCLVSTRQPCMLLYKSQPIRLLLTFLKLAPLITGYSSESQTLNIKLRGYTEGTIPTSCVRVILEQRAEFTRGAGVPVIYEASLKLESKPPFLKRILWSWKWTLYVWVAVMIFVLELLFILVCCTPVIVPRLQPTGV